ncbi:hypothetical protein [Martelella sp. HB161492]|uniref:hypothetical protein n=1 Tax=Martelella sp. HB161492 TaxID=2720726 RepID=UPI001590FBAD|nr:hypothetical protein [Martelella sp. HB161492]
MNAMPRVTRIICPECMGEGYLAYKRQRCQTCAGNGRVSVKDATDYAIKCRMTAEAMEMGPLRDPVREELFRIADQVFDTVGLVAPWRSHKVLDRTGGYRPAEISRSVRLRILDLWETELLTTAEIGRVCRVAEADVCRVLDRAGRGDD